MPLSRHFEIIYILLEKRTITARELAKHFEVSTRTIYRDIDILSAASIPVYCRKGKGGGISLLEGYSFNSSLLTNREQEDILMGLQTLAATEILEMGNTLSKLATMFKKETVNWVEVDFSPWGSEENRQLIFPLMRKAILEQCIITFRYYNTAGQQSCRKIEPAQLLFKRNAWYLAGFCLTRGDSRIFKISRMREVNATGEIFEQRPTVPAIALAEETAGHDPVNIVLRISAEGAYRVYDEFDERSITVNDDGSYTINVNYPLGPWLDSYLLSFGALLEEVSPERVRTRLLNQLDVVRNNLNSGKD